MTRRLDNLDLITVATLAGATAIDAVVGPRLAVLQLPLSMLLVGVLPGYAITSALFLGSFGPHASGTISGIPERLAFSLGLSLTTTGLIGLILNLRFGFSTSAWATALATVTIVASAVAVTRRIGIRQERPQSPWIGFRSLALIVLAVIITTGAVTFDVVSAQRQAYPGFTQLSMLPGGTSTVRLTVTSHERGRLRYLLDLEVGAQTVRRWRVPLRPGQSWQTTVNVGTRRHSLIQAVLRQSRVPANVYRRVYLWPTTS